MAIGSGSGTSVAFVADALTGGLTAYRGFGCEVLTSAGFVAATDFALFDNIEFDDLLTPNAEAAPSLAADPSINSMAMYDAEDDNPIGVKPDFKMNIPVSDSKGGQRNLEVRFLKSDQPNQWYAEIVAVPAEEIVTGGA